MAYPTRAQVVAASSVNELASLSTGEQDALYDEAIQQIEEFCGQAFVPFTGTILHDGTRSDRLYLKRRLTALSSVIFRSTTHYASEFVLAEKGDYLILDRTALGGNYYEQALATVSGDDYRVRGFDAGPSGVAVAGAWGWTAPPTGVATALRLDMEEAALADSSGLASSVRAFRRMGLTSLSQGNLQASLPGDRGPLALSPRVQRLLSPYVWLGPFGRAV